MCFCILDSTITGPRVECQNKKERSIKMKNSFQRDQSGRGGFFISMLKKWLMYPGLSLPMEGRLLMLFDKLPSECYYGRSEAILFLP
jgi:hypothetical protein